MNVQEYILELLYKYDCVIVPDFGGFVAQRKNAVFHPIDYTFDPPKKIVGFNNDLVHSDGLLAHAIAKKEGLSYSDAFNHITEMVNSWNRTLNSEKVLEIKGLGTFYKVQDNLEFKPNKDNNFSFDSFGMQPVKGSYILRKPEAITKTEAKPNPWYSYAAAIGFAVMVGATGFFANDNLIQPQLSSVLPLLNKNIPVTQAEELPVAPRIQISDDKSTKSQSTLEASAEVSDNLNSNIPEENNLDLSVKTYQVIGGSFKVYSKAMEHQAYLKKKGYDRAIIVGKVGNFYMVAFDTFNDATDAANYKRELEKKGFDVFMRP
ncbi:MAG: hypothetical protein ACR2MS_09810 [Weeksellaceae bacterium]